MASQAPPSLSSRAEIPGGGVRARIPVLSLPSCNSISPTPVAETEKSVELKTRLFPETVGVPNRNAGAGPGTCVSFSLTLVYSTLVPKKLP